jgi:hypothetical protein
MDKTKALIEGVTQDIIASLVEEDSISIEEAMDILFNSEVFSKIADVETGLYRESSAYILTILRDEISQGGVIQHEV